MASMEKEQYRSELAKRQQLIAEKKLPVVVIIEGYGTAGKGSVIASVIKYMDPRYFRVYNMDVTTEDEARRPFLYRHAIRMPKQGQFSIYDGGTMDEVVTAYLMGEISKKEYNGRVESIVNYERQLRDNGYLVIKFFIDIDKKTQEKRIVNLLGNKNTKWRVSAKDAWQNMHYDEYAKAFSKYIKKTDTKACPWHIISGDDKDAVDAVDSILPAGTLSGAPKIMACQLINDLENNKRGIYGGAIGYIDFAGNLDTCIAIRIAYRKNGKVFVRSGAGIVADSVPKTEYRECVNKAAAVIQALRTEVE